jgi:hypothetical protein
VNQSHFSVSRMLRVFAGVAALVLGMTFLGGCERTIGVEETSNIISDTTGGTSGGGGGAGSGGGGGETDDHTEGQG